MSDRTLFDRFLAMRAVGRKKDAAIAVKAFVASFVDDDDRARWTRAFLETHRYGEHVRHEVYAEVIFPVLVAGYERNDAWSLYWLAGTTQNLTDLHLARIGHEGDIKLLHRALEIDPGYAQARHELLRAYVAWFSYASHEWPSAILVGFDGASLDDCDLYLAWVARARSLGPDSKQAAFFDDFAGKVRQNRDGLVKGD